MSNLKPRAMKTNLFKRGLLFLLMLGYSMTDLWAQCAMCKATAENAQEGSLTSGLNGGILYLMLIPYLLFFVIGYYIYKNKMSKV